MCYHADKRIALLNIAPHWAVIWGYKASLSEEACASSQNWKIEKQESTADTNNIFKLKQSQSQSQNSPPNFMNIVKPVNTKEKVAKVMSEESAKQAQTIDDQIEKLRAIIDDNSGSYNPSDNQWKRTEKLQHKLRYLEFFKSYEVDNCPE